MNIVMVEFYPTRLRGIGAGACRVWLGISAIIGPLVAGIVVGAFGATAVMGYLFCASVAGWIAVMLLSRNWPKLEITRT
jgi:putative MFS transporter